MALYKNGKLVSVMYVGGHKMSALYKGSKLVYADTMKPGIVLFESTTSGTFSITVPQKANIAVDIVGGGSGGYNAQWTWQQTPYFTTLVFCRAGGGSGGYTHAEFTSKKGTTLSITVGAGSGVKSRAAGGQSKVTDGVNTYTANGGGAASGNSSGNPSPSAGGGGAGSTSKGKSGSTGTGSGQVSGGASVFNGKGAGGASNGAGGVGYVKIYTI